MKERINSAYVKCSDCVKGYFKEETPNIKLVSITTIITAIICYYEYIINGYSSPDGISEGLLYYRNADWHLVCGRWFVRYFNLILGHNIVSPLLVVVGYCLFISASILMLKKLFGIKGKLELVILSAAMIATPAVSTQLTYPHVFMTFAGAFFFSVLCCLFAWNGKIVGSILAIISTMLMMGLYQSYISAIIVIVIMLAIYDLLNGKSYLITFLRCVKCAVISVVGCLLSNWIYEQEIERRGLMASNRVMDFSADIIFADFGKSLYKARHFFSDYFLKDKILGKDVLYWILFVVLLIGIVGCAVKIIKKNSYKGILTCFFVGILLAIIPVAMNTVYILIPYNKVYLVMQSHYVLVFVLLIFIFQWLDFKYIAFKSVFALLMGVVLYANVLNLNATHLAMRQSYEAIETQTRLILDDIYEVDGFVPNQTKIVFIGFPSEEQAQNMLEIYQFSTGLTPNQAFWLDANGETTCREYYLKTYYGIDPGHLTDDDFYTITETPEFNSMPVWPQRGSVQMINGMVAVKLTDSDFPVRP